MRPARSRTLIIISTGTITKQFYGASVSNEPYPADHLMRHIVLYNYRSVIPHTPMGKKVLQCFPWYKRGKDRGKGRLCPPPAVPSVEVQPVFSTKVSWGYDGDESTTHPVYFSHKARVAYRHQMDGNIIDATC
ncbi:uncharacterized protein [Misgurnus anguillicaudatus]|uniref:uncharacterized protein n=1 Tax=Misgurnus anguillicaudatus TaxID=75329 RepID=UPI0024359D3B|nr:uncharacterized protein si:ch211-237l4.6 [Misgurnus anguillicaudatus]